MAGWQSALIDTFFNVHMCVQSSPPGVESMLTDSASGDEQKHGCHRARKATGTHASCVPVCSERARELATYRTSWPVVQEQHRRSRRAAWHGAAAHLHCRSTGIPDVWPDPPCPRGPRRQWRSCPPPALDSCRISAPHSSHVSTPHSFLRQISGSFALAQAAYIVRFLWCECSFSRPQHQLPSFAVQRC